MARRTSLAAGAERATGERARRRSTPLIGAEPVQPSPQAATTTTKAGTTKKAATTKAATKKAAPTKKAGTTKKKAAPTKKSSVKKAARTTTAATRKSSTTKTAAATPVAASVPSATPAPPPAPTPPTSVPADGSRAGRKHRPAPRVTSAPSAGATRQAGARPSRAALTPREKARRDAAARRPHLRVAEPSVPDPTVTREPETSGTPLPDVAELLEAFVSALRLGAQGAGVAPEDVEQRVAQVLAYLRRRLDGDYEVDDFGFDPHFTEHVFYPMLRPLYRHWFRVEVRGIENIPAEGGALVVSNHSGTIALDSLMVQLAIHDEHSRHRTMRALGADLVFQTPFVGTIARRSGSTLATSDDAERLFARGELVGVFPEGFKGTGKRFSERYKLQRFGRGGFVAAALSAGVPIVPCSVVGAEEIAPVLGNMSTLARVLGLPYAPITPTFPWLGPLGLVPLPSKWIIEFGTPIETADHEKGAAEDPMVVFDLTDQVRETIQQTLYTLLMHRRSVFF